MDSNISSLSKAIHHFEFLYLFKNDELIESERLYVVGTLARLYITCGNNEAAVDYLKLYPNNSDFLVVLSDLYRFINPELSLKYLQMAFNINQKKTAKHLGDYYKFMKDTENMKKYYKTGGKLGDVEAYYCLY